MRKISLLYNFCQMNFCLISLWVYHSNSCSSFKQSGRKWTINVNELGIVPKYVRPIESQRPEESRRLWQHVTAALQAGNIREATERKREVSVFLPYLFKSEILSIISI